MDQKVRPLSIVNSVQVIVRGAMAIFYFGNLVALVNDKGFIIWRDERCPIFLIEYLIEYPAPDGRWN